MNWYLRFLLGLPARRQDVRELQEALPELFGGEIPRGRCNPLPILLFWSEGRPTEAIAKELRQWAASHEVESASKSRAATNPEECPATNCPLRGHSVVRTDKGVIADTERPLLNFMVLGGGAKPPLARFLDLVRRTHRTGRAIREVIVTDPYILADQGETGEQGGYENLISYLRALNLKSDNRFILRITSAPKFHSPPRQELFERTIKAAYPYAKIERLPASMPIHDRFYLVRDDRGDLMGVFGPSLNGLGATDIVLMGQFDPTGALTYLSAKLLPLPQSVGVGVKRKP